MSRILVFQAEDGIRDLTVTGVQTCALPISIGSNRPTPNSSVWIYLVRAAAASAPATTPASTTCPPCRTNIQRTARSEERRVGKECVAREMAYASAIQHGLGSRLLPRRRRYR